VRNDAAVVAQNRAQLMFVDKISDETRDPRADHAMPGSRNIHHDNFSTHQFGRASRIGKLKELFSRQ
jgi:hypothetical protein